MRIIEKGKGVPMFMKIKVAILISIFVVPSGYFGLGFYIFFDMSSYNQELDKYYWWDSDDCAYVGERSFQGFYDDADWAFLKKRAQIFEDWTDEYHTCKESWDCATTICEIRFEEGITSPFYDYDQYKLDLNDYLYNEDSKFRKVRDQNPIGGYGDSPIWTGTYMASLAFHYAVACEEGNPVEANECLRKIKKPTDGLHVLTHVTGLPGNLARFAIKDTPANRRRFVDFFYDRNENGQYVVDENYEKEFGRADNKYPGQGEWKDWWYQARTSRDQHIGLFFGYGITYKLLTETKAPWGVNVNLRNTILETIGSDGTDVLDCLIGSNWHVINGEEEIGEGRGHDEASLFPRIPWTSGGDIILGFLNFGKMVEPENYSAYYDEILNRFLSASYHFTIDQSGSYYGNNLAVESAFLTCFLEQDSDVKEYLRTLYNQNIHEYLQFHRNSFFNLAWMIINDFDLENDILHDSRMRYRLDDIIDNLDRFARWRFPSREWHIPQVEDWEDIINQKANMYSIMFDDDSIHILNLLYGAIFGEFTNTDPKSKFALGVDELGETDFVWQRSPFGLRGSYRFNKDHPGHSQNPGIDYTLPYWMGRYMDYIK